MCDGAPRIERRRRWGALKEAAQARLRDEDDPAAIWALLCEYLPHDDHWGAKASTNPQPGWEHWRPKLEGVLRESNWLTLTSRAEEWRDRRDAEAKAKAEREAEERRREEERAKRPAMSLEDMERMRAEFQRKFDRVVSHVTGN